MFPKINWNYWKEFAHQMTGVKIIFVKIAMKNSLKMMQSWKVTQRFSSEYKEYKKQ